ncbi:hypothetical protein ILYODFUR_031093, partial [Ilyodon furcidens]
FLLLFLLYFSVSLSLSCLCAFRLSGAAQDKVCFKSWSVEKPVCHHILISFLWFSGHPVSPH